MIFPLPFTIEVPVHVLGTVIALVVVLILRALLDLEVAVWLIRLLHWVPTRWMFQHAYPRIDGKWKHAWGGDVGRFANEDERQGTHRNYQLFRWVYAATHSQGRVFIAFGRIQGEYLLGRWFEKEDSIGYFGAFQLRIVNSNELNGTWIGHSQQDPAHIGTGPWTWTRVKGRKRRWFGRM